MRTVEDRLTIGTAQLEYVDLNSSRLAITVRTINDQLHWIEIDNYRELSAKIIEELCRQHSGPRLA